MRRLLILISICLPLLCLADNNGGNSYLFKKISRLQGLSNSAALCVFQDSAGLMWFGTYNGLNCYDGRDMEVFHSDFSVPKTLSNNIVHSIQQADSNCLWITNHLGTNRFSLTSRQVVANYEFSKYHSLHSNRNGNTWLVGLDRLYYYNTYYARFIEVDKSNIAMGDPNTRAFVTDDGNLWLFPAHSKDLYRFSLNSFGQDSLSTRLNRTHSSFHSKPIEYISYQNGVFSFVDSDKDLYIYDISGKSKIYTRNIGSLLEQYGDINRIVPFDEDIIIGFKLRSLIRLSASRKYEESIIDANICVFDMYKDPHQGILWIGSDGQGVIMYAKQSSFATNLKLTDFSPNLTRQVRSLMTDKQGGLWCGTKGDGLIYFPDFTNEANRTKAKVYTPNGTRDIGSYSKWDTDFQVFTLKQSRFRNGFWVGSGDTGLYYYSFDSRKLFPVNTLVGNPATHIHTVYEESDSILWLATSETGIRKVWLEETPAAIRIKKQQLIPITQEHHNIITFYSMIPEGDSILWLGSREKGLVKYTIKTGGYSILSLKEHLNKPVYDILCLYRYHDGRIFIGTTAGLISFKQQNGKTELHYTGREQGLLNDMIHGILEDGNGFLWLSTNKGLIKYNPRNDLSHAYYYSGGLQVGEFSDDAYYQCPYSGKLFFGGVDGLVYLDHRIPTSTEYYPNILLRKLTVGSKETNLADYYDPKENILRIPVSETSFSLMFAVPDYLASSEIEYSYLLDGYDKDWSYFNRNNMVTFTNLPAGKYLLKVRYKKDVTDTEYKYLTIPVYILAPWYQSTTGYLIYSLIILSGMGYLLYLRRTKNKKKISFSETGQKIEKEEYSQILHKEWMDSLSPTAPVVSHPITAGDFGSFTEQINCTTDEQINFIRKFICIIEQNLDREDLGSTFIADQMAMSPRQFYRKFKEVSETPPGDLIKNYRIEKAARLLTHTDASIQEVIAGVGVSSRAYFYKEFARKFGMTPKDYRESHKK